MTEPVRMRVQGPDGSTVEAEVLDFKIEREDWVVYKLEDGTTLRMKVTLLKVGKAVDGEGNVRYKADGEPLYFTNQRVELVADVPDFNRKKD